MTSVHEFDLDKVDSIGFLAKGYPIADKKVYFSSKAQLLEGVGLWQHRDFNLINSLTIANTQLDYWGMHSMSPEEIVGVKKQYDSALNVLVDKLVRKKVIMASIPAAGTLTSFQIEQAAAAKLKAKVDMDTWEKVYLLEMGVDSVDLLLDELPLDVVGELSENLGSKGQSVKKYELLDFIFGEGEVCVFSTEKSGIVNYMTKRSYDVSISQDADSWIVSFDRTFMSRLVDERDKRAISNLIRWSEKGEYEIFFGDNEDMLLLDVETFKTIQEQFVSPFSKEIQVQKSAILDNTVSKMVKNATSQRISIISDFKTMEMVGKVREALFELFSISYNGFLPKEACQSVGIYLYECLMTGNPVDVQYFFSPNYDPQSPTELDSHISEFRIQRVETFKKIQNILAEAGMASRFSFYYDDVPEHLEHKVRQYYSDKPERAEVLLHESFEELNKVCVSLLGNNCGLQRLTKSQDFDIYFQAVEGLKQSLLVDQGYLDLVLMIAQEDLASESRHRFGLSKFTCQEEAAKRLAQGIAGVGFCANQMGIGKSIIVTMETNMKELGFFVDKKAAKKFDVDYPNEIPMVLNLQKKVER